MQDVQEGRIRVPVFARNLRWGSSDVLAFFDSLYRGIPVGNLLFARQPADAGTLYFGPVQVRAPGVSDALFVVDGQQRLTAIAAALLHPDPHPRGDIYAIWFDLEAQTFRRLDAPEAPLHWVPLNVLANPVRLLGWLRSWPLNAERADLAERAIDLSTALKQYPLPAYLVEGASGDSVRRMFMRINTSGVPLREVDVLEALLTAGEPRPIAAACLRLEETGFGLLTEKVFIRCLKAVEHWDFHQDTFRAEAPLDPEAINRTEDALRRAITFLTTEAGIPHVQLLPFRLPLVILARFFHLTPNPSPRTRLLLSRWVWRGALADTFKLPDTGYQSGVLSGISGDPHTSVEHLLARVPRTPRYPTASTKWSTLHAPARLCAITLFHMGPRDPETGAVLDLHGLQDLLARKDLKQVFLDVGHSSPSTVARHVFLADAGKLPLLPVAPPDVLQSHGLDAVAADALRKQDLDTFEQRRTQLLDAWCERFFRERTAPDESDRPPISELLRRVDERASTP